MHAMLVGTPRLLTEDGVKTEALSKRAEALTSQAKTLAYVAIDGRAAGVISSQ